jgi:hypothetical protein
VGKTADVGHLQHGGRLPLPARTLKQSRYVVARLDILLAAALDVGLNPDQAGGVRQSDLPGQAAIVGQPISLVDHADPAPLDPTMAFVGQSPGANQA